MASEATRLSDLLDQWEIAQERGDSLSLEALCAACPELLPQLRQQVETLRAVNQRLADSCEDNELRSPAGQRAGYEASFTNLQLLARGGLGVVYTGDDGRLNRQVALKFLRRRLLEDPISQEMFALEAEITSRLEHPGVVPVYGMGETDDGRAFYAMRFIQGETLDDALARYRAQVAREGFNEHALEFRQLLQHFVSVCNTIAYAHSRAILHRDIKPANVMLGRYGETLVVDWGLAMPIVRDERFKTRKDEQTLLVSGSSRLHRSSGQVGTPAYMSPEQISGSAQLNPATDIYALGASLYKLLTGRTPFDAPTLPELHQAIVRGEFPPPAKLEPGVPAALSAICLKAMALQPADRYETALALAEDVERYLADQAVAAYADSLWERTARWGRRHRGLTRLAALGAVLLAIGGLALSAWMTRVAGIEAAARDDADAARQRAELALDELTAAEARSIATALQYQIEEKLAHVEHAAADPELVARMTAAHAAPQDRALWQGVNQWLAEHGERAVQRPRMEDVNWSITLNDGEGTQIARAPSPDPPPGGPFRPIGDSLKYRQYFRGGDPVTPQEKDLFRPITKSFIAAPYRSVNADRPKLSLTAPIWPADGPGGEPLGVLSMTVEVFQLTSLDHLLQSAALDDSMHWDQALTIAYLKADLFDGQTRRDGGLIMQHPAFRGDGVDGKEFAPTYLPGELGEQIRGRAPQPIFLRPYADPLAAVDVRFEGAWSAALAPVALDRHGQRDPSLAEPTWCVIVQRRPHNGAAGR